MSIESTLARISAIEAALTPPRPATGGAAAVSGASPLSGASYTSPTSSAGFSQLLSQAAHASSTVTSGAPLAAVAAARTQVGQAEMPPGSNDSPRIAEYRGAVQGAVVGPWCADFVSWCAAQAGVPLGEGGAGFQSVGALWEWARQSGRAVPASEGTPRPGDLIVWGSEHVGLVESVDPDGTIHTIEGNSSDRVSQRTYGPGASGATGYVSLG